MRSIESAIALKVLGGISSPPMNKISLVFSLLFGSLIFCELPHPYNEIEPLPQNLQGWYSNSVPMETLIRIHRVKTVIEVGSWLGLSTSHIAKTLPDDGVVYAVDHWLGSSEIDPKAMNYPDLYRQFLSNMIHQNLTHKVIPVKLPSVEASVSLKVKPDLIYIDGAHDFVSVFVDLALWYPLIKEGGILCGDDYGWGSEHNFPVKRAVDLFAKENNLVVRSDGWFWYFEPNSHDFLFPKDWVVDP